MNNLLKKNQVEIGSIIDSYSIAVFSNHISFLNLNPQKQDVRLIVNYIREFSAFGNKAL